ncbi:MAG: C40 family peptidase [Muribaculum sp.]|nr:C40 family peptidase [Muribaculum sp.]
MLVMLCVGVALASCSTHKKTIKERTEISIQQTKLSKEEKILLSEAESWIGTPYKYACQEKGRGTDCSGLVMQIYDKAYGVKLPRNSAKQAEYCVPVKEKEVRTGDLVFFSIGQKTGKVSHVGIMLDRESFIHASSSKGVVISKMTNNYYIRHFKMYGRVPAMLTNR